MERTLPVERSFSISAQVSWIVGCAERGRNLFVPESNTWGM